MEYIIPNIYIYIGQTGPKCNSHANLYVFVSLTNTRLVWGLPHASQHTCISQFISLTYESIQDFASHQVTGTTPIITCTREGHAFDRTILNCVFSVSEFLVHFTYSPSYSLLLHRACLRFIRVPDRSLKEMGCRIPFVGIGNSSRANVPFCFQTAPDA